jgi:hypothetical protein
MIVAPGEFDEAVAVRPELCFFVQEPAGTKKKIRTRQMTSYYLFISRTNIRLYVRSLYTILLIIYHSYLCPITRLSMLVANSLEELRNGQVRGIFYITVVLHQVDGS